MITLQWDFDAQTRTVISPLCFEQIAPEMSQEQCAIQVLHSALSTSILRYRRKLYCIRNKCVLWPYSAGVCSQWVGSGRKHLWYCWQQVTAKSGSTGVSSSRQLPLSTERRGCTKGTQSRTAPHILVWVLILTQPHKPLQMLHERQREQSHSDSKFTKRASPACAAQRCTVSAQQQQWSLRAQDQSPFHTQCPNACASRMSDIHKSRGKQDPSKCIF